MNNTIENIDSLAYAMSDEELMALSNTIFQNKIKGQNLSKMSSQERLSLIEYSKKIPLTKKAINTFIKLGFYTKDELEKENKRLYTERKWEQYL